MNFNHEELMLMMLYNTGTRLGLIHELRLMQCYLMPDETALRELSEGVIEKLKLLTVLLSQALGSLDGGERFLCQLVHIHVRNLL